MLEALLSTLRDTWPMYLIAFGGAEILFYLQNSRGWRAVVVAAVAMLLVLFAVSLVHGSSWAIENHLLKLIAVNLISLVVPVAAIVAAVLGICRFRSAPMQHAALAAVVFSTMFFFPLWALMVVCGSGLDCL